ncbi:hypothetical protein [Labrys wisconsinensis]|uniref:Uncharacterized protein n=1 Tax=Labrys wisconsinensis TaxID=425677 RepID=A0ABU0JN98_9HYPH|nr:hypothetical protein [Labrys wisconsinensis]MDQ0474976.1 hypothetical protein [Labrys wisconsinensis]
MDEYNFVSADRTYDLESDKLIGAFSAALLRRIATLIKRTAAERRIRAVRCT